MDSLDTLWIMGLKEEFEEAAKAIDKIDFTTSPRSDIPVFETTIRYLGGLLAAYDVSGGKYKNLLEKAIELAEILMGAFDTPNRMPVLFYQWKPAFASQPHRAGQRANLAELGSLSMEFTRLAQLTKDPRYYDAVARVTNALSEFQDRGTKLDGVFPENVDTSGCNRTVPFKPQQPIATSQSIAISPARLDQEPQGYKPNMPQTVVEPKPKKKQSKTGPGTLEMDIVPGELNKAHIVGWDENRKSKSNKRSAEEKIPEGSSPLPETDSVLLSSAKSRVESLLDNWDCTPQGLESSNPSGYNKFSMGGGQDSTYEYFPKVRGYDH